MALLPAEPERVTVIARNYASLRSSHLGRITGHERLQDAHLGPEAGTQPVSPRPQPPGPGPPEQDPLFLKK